MNARTRLPGGRIVTLANQEQAHVNAERAHIILVSRSEWARAFLEAQSPNPTVRQRGRDALTAMGCQWVDPAESPSAPAN